MATQLKSGESEPYAIDVAGWADAQVAALLARRADLLDWDNLAEEIGDVGKSQAEALESALRIVLLHLLKWDHQPERRTRSWVISIKSHRNMATRRLRKNPSLKASLAELLADAYDDARAQAAIETGRPTSAFPAICPYDWDATMTRPIAWEGEEA